MRKAWEGSELCVNSAGQDVTACKVLLLQETWNVGKFQTNFIECHLIALKVGIFSNPSPLINWFNKNDLSFVEEFFFLALILPIQNLRPF